MTAASCKFTVFSNKSAATAAAAVTLVPPEELAPSELLAQALAGEAYLLFDGGLGTQLQARGLAVPGQLPDLLCLTNPAGITEVHRAYVQAGAQVITTNTFGANADKLADQATVEEVYAAAVRCAREAGAPLVAGDVGPAGMLLEPLGTLSFDAAYELFAQQVRAATAAGCDLLALETFADLREAKAALLAAKENSHLPVSVSMTFGEDGRTFLGTTPEIAAEVLSSLGADIVGVNCSLGPAELADVVRRMVGRVRCPLLVQPNAGLPRMEGGETVFDVGPEEFARAMLPMVEAGASVLGGCCGTTPEHIARLSRLVTGFIPEFRAHEPALCVTSAQEMMCLPSGSAQVAVVGERINPTGKPRMKEALRSGTYDVLVGEAVAQANAGAAVLDVNAGLPGIDEQRVLAEVVGRLQAVVTTPLQIDSSDPIAMEAAVRSYAGKPLVNSVNGSAESLSTVLPLVKRYGCAVVGLTLDEGGIPSTAEGRFRIAERIVMAAEEMGIPRCDVVIDCLAMAVAAGQEEAYASLGAIRLVKERLGVRTMLGVSNVSFGLPQRGLMNATYLAAALGAGLDLAIANPLDARTREVLAAFRVLNGEDADAAAFIDAYAVASESATHAAAGTLGSAGEATAGAAQAPRAGGEAAASVEADSIGSAADSDVLSAESRVREGVMSGRPELVAGAVEELLQGGCETLGVVEGMLVPALDEVGQRYEQGTFFLPQLMASAEAAKAGFTAIEEYVARTAAEGVADDSYGSRDSHAASVAGAESRTIVLATVKGDIHDIGKNIVGMLLQNYGYHVVDLGRDVPPEAVLEAVQEHHARLVGLSALMTTTVKAMEDTVALLHEQAPDVRVVVGGAVLTPEYAQAMGADYYAKDAAEATKVAAKVFG